MNFYLFRIHDMEKVRWYTNKFLSVSVQAASFSLTKFFVKLLFPFAALLV